MATESAALMTANLIDEEGKRTGQIGVPMIWDGVVPDVPHTVLIPQFPSSRVAVLVGTRPLTYQDYGVPSVGKEL